eukprot:3138736-Pleurochrysis_carterae.AAC.2
MFSDRRACGAGCASARMMRPATTEDSGRRSINMAPMAINGDRQDRIRRHNGSREAHYGR